MTHFLKIALLGAALVTVSPSQDRRDPQSSRDTQQSREGQAARSEGQQQTKRYYDKAGRDYHEWNQDEDRRYREYARERHLGDRDFNRLSSRQQSDYFRWSHEHQQNSAGRRDDDSRQRGNDGRP